MYPLDEGLASRNPTKISLGTYPLDDADADAGKDSTRSDLELGQDTVVGNEVTINTNLAFSAIYGTHCHDLPGMYIFVSVAQDGALGP